MIAQILGGVRVEIVARTRVDVFDVSLVHLVERMPVYLSMGLDPVATFVERGVAMDYIRPSRRIRIQAPEPALCAYTLPPPDLVTERIPRYAHKQPTRKST